MLRRNLDEIMEDIRNCVRCPLYDYRRKEKYMAVPGDGNPHANVVLIGEGPGETEAKKGLPFVGKSGRCLTTLLGRLGISRDELFLTNAVCCRPPDNRTPARGEMAACKPWIHELIYAIDPYFIISVGAVAAQSLLGTGTYSISDNWGVVHDVTIPGNIIEYTVPMISVAHPSAILRQGVKEMEGKRKLSSLMHYSLFYIQKGVLYTDYLHAQYTGSQVRDRNIQQLANPIAIHDLALEE